MSVFRLIRRQAFALAIILCAASAYLWPGLYIEWFGVKLTPFVGPSIQLIMFGMGTTLTAADFLCVAKTRGAWPWGRTAVLDHAARGAGRADDFVILAWKAVGGCEENPELTGERKSYNIRKTAQER